MFSAIVTAMLGAFWLSSARRARSVARLRAARRSSCRSSSAGSCSASGSRSAGLCPGTSCVAAATGRGDGIDARRAGCSPACWSPGSRSDARALLREHVARRVHAAAAAARSVRRGGAAVVCVASRVSRRGARRSAESLRRRAPSDSRHSHARRARRRRSAYSPAVAGSPYVERHAAVDVDALARSRAARGRPRHRDRARAVGSRIAEPRFASSTCARTKSTSAFHVPTAERVPIDSLASTSFVATRRSYSTRRAARTRRKAWVFLRALGYDRVYFLRGGVYEWLDQVMNPHVRRPRRHRRTVQSSRS